MQKRKIEIRDNPSSFKKHFHDGLLFVKANMDYDPAQFNAAAVRVRRQLIVATFFIFLKPNKRKKLH